MTGDVLSEITVSSRCVYSVAFQENSAGATFNFLAAAGSSAYVDVCSPNFSYKDRTVRCFGEKKGNWLKK